MKELAKTRCSTQSKTKLDEMYATALPLNKRKKLPKRSSYCFSKIIWIFAAFVTIAYLYFPSSLKPKPLMLFNLTHPFSKYQLSEFLLATDQLFEFPQLSFQQTNNDTLHYKIQKVRMEPELLTFGHKYILPEYGLFKEQNLYILQHKKFTSCRVGSFLRSFFYQLLGFNDCFSGSNKVTKFDNNQLWQSSGNRITFYADSFIRPFYFAVKVPQQKLSTRIQIFGFRIQSEIIAVTNMLSSYHLGSYQLNQYMKEQDNMIYLPCKNSQCSLSYLYIMVIMEQLKLEEINIYVDS